MAISRIKFDEQALKRAVEDGAKQYLLEREQELNSLFRRMKGEPLDDIKKALVQNFEEAGGSITEPDLTVYAEAAQEGREFHFEIT